jgi:hypothetical protein
MAAEASPVPSSTIWLAESKRGPSFYQVQASARNAIERTRHCTRVEVWLLWKFGENATQLGIYTALFSKKS